MSFSIEKMERKRLYKKIILKGLDKVKRILFFFQKLLVR